MVRATVALGTAKRTVTLIRLLVSLRKFRAVELRCAEHCTVLAF